LRRMDERRAKALKIDIDLLDQHIAEVIEANVELKAKNAILRSMKSVGPVLAHTLLALLPELGELTRKQIAALVGIAASARDHDAFQHSRGVKRSEDLLRLMLAALWRIATQGLVPEGAVMKA